jgi:CheY-like chemotaxis protein
MKKPLKVLHVDDDAFQLATVAMWLRSVKHEVVSRNSPFGTTREVIRDQPDILLLDISMPGLDGKALAETARKQLGKTGIIFYSGQDRATLDKLVAEYGALGAIEKTPNGRDFLESFDRLSARRLQ